MTDNYDAVMVGAGHNGLICATYLAKAGKKVLVLEANATPGGCAATREFAPGYSVSSCAQWLNQLHPAISRDLALEQHGLQWAAQNLPSISLDEQGKHLSLLGNKVEGANVSAEDRAAFVAFHAKTEKAQLKGLLSLDSLLGSRMGPRTPNTVFGYLYRRVGETLGNNGQALVKGGMGALGEAMAASARAAGVEIRLQSPVASIDVEADRAVGVTLAGGEQITAPLVVSNADPVTTFQHLVGFARMETGMARRVSHIRCKSGTAKLHLALSGLPQFTGLDDAQHGARLLVAPDMNYIERAYNAVKYDEYSSAPALDISIPTLHDATLAPAGGHVLSAIVQFAPYAPEGGWEAHRETFMQLVIERIAAFAPGIREQIISSQLLTPADLESDYRMSGGHWHHGELSLDQIMMMRPFPGATQYGTAFDGLYLCGAGAHPGGGVMGLAGRNAAREIIKRGAAA